MIKGTSALRNALVPLGLEMVYCNYSIKGYRI